MDEETEENMRKRFLAIEQRVSELGLKCCQRREIYKLEEEVAELNSKLLNTCFYLKEAQETLSNADEINYKARRNINISFALCGILIFFFFFYTW